MEAEPDTVRLSVGSPAAFVDCKSYHWVIAYIRRLVNTSDQSVTGRNSTYHKYLGAFITLGMHFPKPQTLLRIL